LVWVKLLESQVNDVDEKRIKMIAATQIRRVVVYYHPLPRQQ
jgi:hypothetical protein